MTLYANTIRITTEEFETLLTGARYADALIWPELEQESVIREQWLEGTDGFFYYCGDGVVQ